MYHSEIDMDFTVNRFFIRELEAEPAEPKTRTTIEGFMWGEEVE